MRRNLATFALAAACGLAAGGCSFDPGAVPGIVDHPARHIVAAATTHGPVNGIASPLGQAFLGIPYAAPPTGAARWRAPQPPAPWSVPRDATRLGNICVQNLDLNPLQGVAGGLIVPGSEDCLNLNVYAPANAVAGSRLPVMVWIHGGAFVLGWSGQYDPSVLARNAGVVVVAINYRLAALGFFAHPALDAESPEEGGSGAFAVLDQQLALRWVRDNIAEFGGDPTNVTLFGESAGAWSVCYQLASPGAAGLFQRAILESGSCTSPVSAIAAADANAGGELLAAALGCVDPATAIDCLRGKPARDLITAVAQRPGLLGPNSWNAAYGNPILPLRPRDAFAQNRFNHVPLINGSNHDEGRLFVGLQNLVGNLTTAGSYASIIARAYGTAAPKILNAYPAQAYDSPGLAYAAVITDSIFACPARTLDRLLAPQVRVYAYEFNDPDAVTAIPQLVLQLPLVPPLPLTTPLKSYHASEIAYVLQSAWALADPARFSPAQRLLSQRMQAYWSAFAHLGAPAAPAGPAWPPYHPATDVSQMLRPDGIRAGGAFAADHKCAFWADLGF